MQLTADLVYGFAGSVLSKRFDGAKKTPACHLEWWEMCCSDHPMVAIAAPRGHAKSTAITHCYTLAAVLFKDRQYVIIVSNTYDQSVLFLNEIKNELLENEMLIDLFGKMEFEKDAEHDIIVRMQDGHKFRITAKGSEQKVRGLKWLGKRPDLIVCDDMEDDEIVMNKERRDKFKKWFMGALSPVRSERGIIRMVGTILHMDSLLQNFMPSMADRTYTRDLGLKVINLKKKRSWYSAKYRAHTKDFKEILWPEMWPKSRLLTKRQEYIDVGNPEGYSQEYLNEPIDESRAFFRRADLQPMEEDDLFKHKQRMLTYYMAVDFAIGEKERTDYTVMVVGGMDEFGILHLVDVVRERMDSREIIDTMIALNDKYDPVTVTVERGMIEKAIGPFLEAEMISSGSFMALNPMVPTKDKEARARSIQGRLRAGGVKFNKNADWYPDFEQELLTFPRSVHDDQVDAFAWLGLTINKMRTAPTEEELEDEEYNTMLEENGYFEEGRNTMTGY